MFIIDGKEIKSIEDLPEPLQCGSILSEMLFQPNLHQDDEVIDWAKSMNLSQEWINYILKGRNIIRNKFLE